MQNVNTLCIAAQSPQDTHATYGIVQRTQSDRMANRIRSGGERNPIGRRTETGGDVPPTDAPTKQTERVSHKIRGTHRTFWQRKPPTDRHRCAQIRRVWHPAIPTPPITPPNHLWKSVKSVGEYPLPEASVNSVNSVGGLQRVAWVWQDAIPSYENSHRLHGCAQIMSN